MTCCDPQSCNLKNVRFRHKKIIVIELKLGFLITVIILKFLFGDRNQLYSVLGGSGGALSSSSSVFEPSFSENAISELLALY